MSFLKKIFLLYSLFVVIPCKAQDKIYLFSYFKGNGADGLHLAYSNDGYLWKSLNNDNPFLKPDTCINKLMRDPCIIKGIDGIFRMVWTGNWATKGIGYASSKDLVNWSKQKLIPVMEHEENVRNCWAPEITYDKNNKEYMIYWSSTIRGRFPSKQQSEDEYNHRIYYTITKDFETFSTTKLLYDKGFNVIDATIVPIEDKFGMFMKNESLYPPEKNIRISFSNSLKGPYTDASEPLTGNYWAEGPTVLKISNKWIVYFDKYREAKYGAIESQDLLKWEDISDKVQFPKGARHGSVLEISTNEFQLLTFCE